MSAMMAVSQCDVTQFSFVHSMEVVVVVVVLEALLHGSIVPHLPR